MKLSEVQQCVLNWYLSGKSICLTSPPGTGKTATLSTAPAQLSQRLGLNMGFVVMNGGCLNEMDVQGYLVPRHHDTHTDSLFTRPFWWTTSEGKPLDAYDGGIVLVDEYDKCPVEVKKILGEGCYSGRLGPHTLPGPRKGRGGWRIWLAGNRASDRSGSTKELDHLINRIMFVPVQNDIDGWTDWATKAGVMPQIIAFANANPEIVFSGKVPDKQGPYCTARSTEAVSDFLKVLVNDDVSADIPLNPLVNEQVAGLIGENAQMQLVNTLRLAQDMPKFEKIVADPLNVKVPERPDACMLICFNLAHRVDEKTAEPIIKYVERMPKEFSVVFVKAACNRTNKLVNTPAFQSWAHKNASLVAVIASGRR